MGHKIRHQNLVKKCESGLNKGSKPSLSMIRPKMRTNQNFTCRNRFPKINDWELKEEACYKN